MIRLPKVERHHEQLPAEALRLARAAQRGESMPRGAISRQCGAISMQRGAISMQRGAISMPRMGPSMGSSMGRSPDVDPRDPLVKWLRQIIAPEPTLWIENAHVRSPTTLDHADHHPARPLAPRARTRAAAGH